MSLLVLDCGSQDNSINPIVNRIIITINENISTGQTTEASNVGLKISVSGSLTVLCVELDVTWISIWIALVSTTGVSKSATKVE